MQSYHTEQSTDAMVVMASSVSFEVQAEDFDSSRDASAERLDFDSSHDASPERFEGTMSDALPVS